ncbi:MAG: voltage-gated potassium channel [Acidimicrobiales bacterium]
MPNNMFDSALDRAVAIANRPMHLSIVSAALVCLGGAGYAVAEGQGPITSLWWAVVTASTVGYGDAYPETTAGRGVATLLIISMVTLIIPMITASFTSKLIVDRDAFTHEEQEQIKKTLQEIASKLEAFDQQNRSTGS